MRTIRLAMDEKCISERKIVEDRLGGAERMFMLWDRYLTRAGYAVSRWPAPPLGHYDLCIHSNQFDGRVQATKHLLWGGSWHVGQYRQHADKVVLLTDFMREKYGWEPGACEIIPAPYDHDLLKYRSKDFIPRRIVSNSNPSRFFPHMVKVAEMLAAKGEEFEWHFCGGSQLYSPNYPEEYNLYSGPPQLIYRGCLPRHEMIGMLTLGHVLAYPTFHDIWETQGVAFLEAGALGLPVILTKIRPLTDVMPEALFCSSHEEFVEAILEAFKHTGRVEYPELVRYDSDVVFGKLLKIVNDLTGGPE